MQPLKACCGDIEDLHLPLLSAEALAQLDRLEQGAGVIGGGMADSSGNNEDEDDWARLDEDDWARLDELERKASQPTVTAVSAVSAVSAVDPSSSSALTTLRQALLCAAFVVEAVHTEDQQSSSSCRVKVLSCRVMKKKKVSRTGHRGGEAVREAVTIELSGEWSVTYMMP